MHGAEPDYIKRTRVVGMMSVNVGARTIPAWILEQTTIAHGIGYSLMRLSLFGVVVVVVF
jgi:hypothetical protein